MILKFAPFCNINELQKFCASGSLKIVNTTNCEKFIEQMWLLISSGHVLKLRKHIIENEEKFNGDYQILLKTLFNHIDTSTKIPDAKKKMQTYEQELATFEATFPGEKSWLSGPSRTSP